MLLAGTGVKSSPVREATMRSELFSKALVNNLRVKFEKEGLEKLHTNELLVLVTDHFGGRLEAIADDLNRRLEAIVAPARLLAGALWIIALGVVAGLILRAF